MSAQYWLREEAADLDRAEERLTAQIEDTEKQIVELRRKRDDVRFHRAETRAAADLLDRVGFRVERDGGGMVTVFVDPPMPAGEQ